jgi:hypothetical protein
MLRLMVLGLIRITPSLNNGIVACCRYVRRVVEQNASLNSPYLSFNNAPKAVLYNAL